MQTKEGTGRGGGGVALYFVSGAVFGRAIIMQDALQGNDTEPLLAPIMLPVRLSQQQISTAVGERQTKCDDQPELLEVEPEALVPVERLVQVCQQAGRWSELIPIGCQKVSETSMREAVGEKWWARSKKRAGRPQRPCCPGSRAMTSKPQSIC